MQISRRLISSVITSYERTINGKLITVNRTTLAQHTVFTVYKNNEEIHTFTFDRLTGEMY